MQHSDLVRHHPRFYVREFRTIGLDSSVRKLVELNGQPEESRETAEELRNAIHQHLNNVRDQIADLAFVSAVYETHSQAA